MTEHKHKIGQIVAMRDELIDGLNERQLILFEKISEYSLESLKLMTEINDRTKREVDDLLKTLRNMGIKV